MEAFKLYLINIMPVNRTVIDKGCEEFLIAYERGAEATGFLREKYFQLQMNFISANLKSAHSGSM